MYLRKIDYEILKMMRDSRQSWSKEELKNYSESIDSKSNFENTFKYHIEQGFITLRYEPEIYSITILGEVAVEEYELKIRSALTLPEESNKIAIESNKISNKANTKSSASNFIAGIALAVAILDIILRFIYKS